MNILIIGNINSDYITSLASHLRSSMPEIDRIDILSKQSSNRAERTSCFNTSSFIDAVCPNIPLPVRFKTLIGLKKLSKDYDIVLIHYLHLRYLYVLRELKKHCKHIVSVVWGSDFLQINNKTRKKLIPLYLASSGVVVSRYNKEMAKEVSDFYQLDPKKLFGCPFGSNIIDYQMTMKDISSGHSRKLLNLSSDKIVITIGYNRNPIHQHLKIIKLLSTLPQSWNNKLELVFPLTYGDNGKYYNQIKEKARQLPFSCVFFEDFLSTEEVFHLRNTTDIFILLQKTDANSNTIVEHLFAKNIVITGDWLPYKYLKEQNVFFHEIASIEQLPNKLLECLTNLKSEKVKFSNNQNNIAQLKGWRNLIDEWTTMIKTITKA